MSECITPSTTSKQDAAYAMYIKYCTALAEKVIAKYSIPHFHSLCRLENVAEDEIFSAFIRWRIITKNEGL